VLSRPKRSRSTEARTVIDRADFVWHQRFELAPGVFTPGVHDINWLLDQTDIGARLADLRVIDVGTSNGGVAFELEARGATVTAVDIAPIDHFGFDQLRRVRDANTEFVQASVYDLDVKQLGTFDIVIAFGLVYHLMNPLLAIERLTALLGEGASLYVESAVVDAYVPSDMRDVSLARFYGKEMFAHDPSNWFVPTTRCLLEWCETHDLSAEIMRAWPSDLPSRALVKARRDVVW
jgi:SAM-dependent methyltransferase